MADEWWKWDVKCVINRNFYIDSLKGTNQNQNWDIKTQIYKIALWYWIVNTTNKCKKKKDDMVFASFLV